MKALAYLFPGQGSQRVGMGRDLCDSSPLAKQVFDEADDALGTALSRLMFEGSEDELKKTANAQPAILTHSIAALRCFEAASDEKPTHVAGHSLGEYSALVAAGSLSFADAVKAVHFRGKVMQEAVPLGTGAMAAVLGLEPDQVEAVCRQVSEQEASSYVSVANFNGPGQTVISGTTQGVEQATQRLKESGARRVMPLPVSAPFHCQLMKPAQEKLASYLQSVSIQDACVPLVSNVEANFVQKGDAIRSLLIEQVVAPVRFTQMITRLREAHVTRFVELGPGKVLSGIVKRMIEDADIRCVEGVSHDLGR